MVLHLNSLPDTLREKVRGFSPYDRREGSLVTLLLKDGRRIRNVYVANDEEARAEQDRTLDLSEIQDAVRQAWQESEAEKPWWDPENKDWWKS